MKWSTFLLSSHPPSTPTLHTYIWADGRGGGQYEMQNGNKNGKNWKNFKFITWNENENATEGQKKREKMMLNSIVDQKSRNFYIFPVFYLILKMTKHPYTYIPNTTGFLLPFIRLSGSRVNQSSQSHPNVLPCHPLNHLTRCRHSILYCTIYDLPCSGLYWLSPISVS